MKSAGTSAIMSLLVGLTTHLQAATAPERFAAFLSPTVSVGRPCECKTRKGNSRGRLAAVVNARHQTKLQGDKNMPTRTASRRTPPVPPKPKFQSIPGALSLYRTGDVITYTLDGIEFESPIQSIEMDEGEPVLWVTPTIGIPPSHVKRVERRGR